MLLLQFTYFAIMVCHGEVCCDHISVTDGHNSSLMSEACGFSSQAQIDHNLLQVMRSTSNIVNIFFSTDGSHSHAGWSLSWSAVTPGLKV